MLDVDNTNRACTEALDLYGVYRDLYGRLHDRRVRDALGGAVCPAFRPQLELPEGGNAVIDPITDAKATLASVAGESRRATSSTRSANISPRRMKTRMRTIT